MDQVKITRSGEHLFLKGPDRPAIEGMVAQLVAQGARMLDAIRPLGNNWIATVVEHAGQKSTEWCQVTSIGLQSVIEGSSHQIVADRIEELSTYGAVRVAGPEIVNDKWVAVVDTRANGPAR